MGFGYWLRLDGEDDFDYEDEHVELESDKKEYGGDDGLEEDEGAPLSQRQTVQDEPLSRPAPPVPSEEIAEHRDMPASEASIFERHREEQEHGTPIRPERGKPADDVSRGKESTAENESPQSGGQGRPVVKKSAPRKKEVKRTAAASATKKTPSHARKPAQATKATTTGGKAAVASKKTAVKKTAPTKKAIKPVAAKKATKKTPVKKQPSKNVAPKTVTKKTEAKKALKKKR